MILKQHYTDTSSFSSHGMPVAYHCALAVAQQVLGQEVTVPGFSDIFLPSRKVAIPGAQQRSEAERAAKLGPEELGDMSADLVGMDASKQESGTRKKQVQSRL